MSSPNHPQSEEPDATVPSNRAARRAKRKGKAAAGQQSAAQKKDVRNSQVMAQPKFKGRRGNR